MRVYKQAQNELRFITLESAALHTVHEHDPIWTDAAAKTEHLSGALVRLIPPPDATLAQVVAVRERVQAAGAIAVRVVPNGRKPVVQTGDRSPVRAPQLRPLISSIIDGLHVDVDRDELRAAIEAALCEEGI